MKNDSGTVVVNDPGEVVEGSKWNHFREWLKGLTFGEVLCYGALVSTLYVFFIQPIMAMFY